MEYLPAIVVLGFFFNAGLLIAITELREWRTNAKYARLKEYIADLAESVDSAENRILGELITLKNYSLDIQSTNIAMKISLQDLDARLELVDKEMQRSQEFIQKASVDLATIVNEYKLNGIPLNLIRKPHIDPYDMVEGI